MTSVAFSKIAAIKARFDARRSCTTCRGFGVEGAPGFYLDWQTCDRCGGKGWT